MFSPISISESTNFFNSHLLWFLSQLANWEKKLFWTKKKFVFYFNCSSWKKIMEKISETNWWKHLMNSLLVVSTAQTAFSDDLHILRVFVTDYFWKVRQSTKLSYCLNYYYALCSFILFKKSNWSSLLSPTKVRYLLWQLKKKTFKVL